MTHRLDAWTPFDVGDQVIVRERATAHEAIVTVRILLEPLEGEGPGFVDDTGSTFRHHLHSAQRVDGSETLTQQTVNELFSELIRHHLGTTE
jgi:hypothetical protein